MGTRELPTSQKAWSSTEPEKNGLEGQGSKHACCLDELGKMALERRSKGQVSDDGHRGQGTPGCTAEADA